MTKKTDTMKRIKAACLLQTICFLPKDNYGSHRKFPSMNFMREQCPNLSESVPLPIK